MDDPNEALTIGELAERTGLAPATLRMWEARHGFPRPHRLAGGHRRYPPETIAQVQAVLGHQAAGKRLAAAIGEAASAPPTTASVFAELRRGHPDLLPRPLRKSTLVSLSRAIEDEYAAAGSHALLCGAFQHERHLQASLARWRDLARTTRTALVFATGSPGPRALAPLIRVPLADDSPMRREWVVVCESDAFSAVLSAWELPGQDAEADGDRLLEAVWSVDPAITRAAARVCAQVAEDAGVGVAADLVTELAHGPPGQAESLRASLRLFSRTVAYLDQAGRGDR